MITSTVPAESDRARRAARNLPGEHRPSTQTGYLQVYEFKRRFSSFGVRCDH
jgi:hypothetical protein